MPVIDHAVHPSVVIGDGHRYGCWGRTEMPALVDLGPLHGLIPNRMSRTCRYDRSLADPACAGCPSQGLGEEYDRMIRENGR